MPFSYFNLNSYITVGLFISSWTFHISDFWIVIYRWPTLYSYSRLWLLALPIHCTKVDSSSATFCSPRSIHSSLQSLKSWRRSGTRTLTRMAKCASRSFTSQVLNLKTQWEALIRPSSSMRFEKFESLHLIFCIWKGLNNGLSYFVKLKCWIKNC